MKKILMSLPVIIAFAIIIANVFALDIGNVDNPFNNNGQGIPDVDKAVKNIWSTVIIIVQILAVAAVVFAGLRYMFASADAKADIKRSMGMLAVGAIFVFAATTILQFVVKAAKEAIPNR